jgi:hypothetical protein
MPDERSPLVEINAMALYAIGYRIGRFEALLLTDTRNPEQTGINEWTDFMLGVKWFINNPIVPAGLERSMEAARDVEKIGEQHMGWLSRAQPIPVTPTNVNDFVARINQRLQMAIDTFRSVLLADIDHSNIYFVPQRLAYDTNTLLEEASRLFGRNRTRADELAGPDIAECGRCFAFGLWSATAFHILRACELVIADYCEACQLKIDRNKYSWADYINALGTVRELPRKIKGRLDRLREYDRNKIMHPGHELLGEHDVSTLLAFVVAVMTEMIEDADKRRERSG